MRIDGMFPKNNRKGLAILLGLLVGFAAMLSMPAIGAGVDWDKVAATEIIVFQPGQHSWEWLLIPGDHGSNPARRIREGRPCLACHQGEEAVIGSAMVAGADLEPKPLSGMPGSIELQVQAAVSGDYLKLRVSWPAVEAAGPSGIAEAGTMLTFAIGDGEALPPARYANCWLACHSDLAGMQAAAGADRSKYLPNSRTGMTRTGGADDYKPAGELAAELEKGAFLEFWSVFLDGSEITLLHDGYILEARRGNEQAGFKARARRDGDHRVVELSRPLAPGEGPRKSLVIGKEYPFSIALHENHAGGRHHYVSFPLVLKPGRDDSRITGVTEAE